MKNIINHQNYEACYLDYLEGNLNGEATAQLLLFLDNNPELKSELEEGDLIILKPEQELTFDKEQLLQQINENNVENYIIASIEREIDETDEKELTDYLNQNPAAQVLASRYQKTILPASDIVFPNKAALKRRSAVMYYLIPALSTAAIVLIFLLFYNPSPSNTDLPIASDPINTEVEHPVNEIRVAEYDLEVEPAEQDSPAPILESTLAAAEEDVQNAERSIANEGFTTVDEDKTLEMESNIVNDNNERVASVVDNNLDDKKPKEKIPNEKVILPELEEGIAEINIEKDPTEKRKDETTEVIAKVKEPEIKIAPLETMETGENSGTTEPIIIADNTDLSTTGDEALKIGQLLNRGIRKNVFKEETPSTDRVEGNELLEAVANGIDKTVKTKVNYKYKKEKKSRSFALSIGSFEFSRTKSD